MKVFNDSSPVWHSKTSIIAESPSLILVNLLAITEILLYTIELLLRELFLPPCHTGIRT